MDKKVLHGWIPCLDLRNSLQGTDKPKNIVSVLLNTYRAKYTYPKRPLPSVFPIAKPQIVPLEFDWGVFVILLGLLLKGVGGGTV